jgi:energy-coupling factor transporter ATP-binding protein EcfA2
MKIHRRSDFEQILSSYMKTRLPKVPQEITEIIESGVPEGERSDKFYHVVCTLKELGFTQEQIFAKLDEFPDGIGRKYEGRLQIEIGRVFEKHKKLHNTSPAHIATIDEINKTFFVTTEGGKTLIFEEAYDYAQERSVLKRHSLTGFKALFMNKDVTIQYGDKTKKVELGQAWLKSPDRREYPKGVALLPKVLEPKGVYNMWRGFAKKPRAVSWDHLQDFLFQIICKGDSEVYSYLVRFLADMVQNPGRVPGVAIVLRGARGTGKSTLFEFLDALIGQHSTRIPTPGKLAGNFNQHLRDAILVCVDEFSGKEAKKYEGVLKSLITEPQIAIEAKGIDIVNAKNYCHFFFAANDAFAVPSAKDERRFCVIDVSDSRKQDHNYFKDLRNNVYGGELEGFLYELEKMDLSDFNVFDVPQTEALKEQKIFNLDPVNRWVFAKLSEGEINGRIWSDRPLEIAVKEAHKDYCRFINDYKLGDIEDSAPFGKKVSKIISVENAGKRKLPEGLGRGHFWRLRGLFEAREDFQNELGLDDSVWLQDERLEMEEILS